MGAVGKAGVERKGSDMSRSLMGDTASPRNDDRCDTSFGVFVYKDGVWYLQGDARLDAHPKGKAGGKGMSKDTASEVRGMRNFIATLILLGIVAFIALSVRGGM